MKRDKGTVKKFGIVLLMGAALAMAAPATANQIQVAFSGSTSGTGGYSGYGPYQTGQGGEFTLNDVNGNPANSWLDLSGYSALASSQTKNLGPSGITSFQTFCIEENEYIYPYPATYDVTLSGGAVNGGKGGSISGSDPLSKGTAFLYSQFAQGVLAGYDYGAGRGASAAALQEAFWFLEDEISSYTSGNIFMALVKSSSLFGSDAGAKANATPGQYGVYVLNLTGAGGGAPNGPGQDQLYYHVPDGGMTLALLGMAMCALAVASRRFKNA